MSLVVWCDEYVTGNITVDEQHQQLFAIMNNLHDAMKVGQGKKVVKATLDELLDYTVNHFQMEESLMRTYNYPEYQSHKKIHDELTAKVASWVRDFERPSTVLTIEVSRFLTSWLINHIRERDQKMIKFLREHIQAESA